MLYCPGHPRPGGTSAISDMVPRQTGGSVAVRCGPVLPGQRPPGAAAPPTAPPAPTAAPPRSAARRSSRLIPRTVSTRSGAVAGDGDEVAAEQRRLGRGVDRLQHRGERRRSGPAARSAAPPGRPGGRAGSPAARAGPGPRAGRRRRAAAAGRSGTPAPPGRRCRSRSPRRRRSPPRPASPPPRSAAAGAETHPQRRGVVDLDRPGPVALQLDPRRPHRRARPAASATARHCITACANGLASAPSSTGRPCSCAGRPTATAA